MAKHFQVNIKQKQIINQDYKLHLIEVTPELSGLKREKTEKSTGKLLNLFSHSLMLEN